MHTPAARVGSRGNAARRGRAMPRAEPLPCLRARGPGRGRGRAHTSCTRASVPRLRSRAAAGTVLAPPRRRGEEPELQRLPAEGSCASASSCRDRQCATNRLEVGRSRYRPLRAPRRRPPAAAGCRLAHLVVADSGPEHAARQCEPRRVRPATASVSGESASGIGGQSKARTAMSRGGDGRSRARRRAPHTTASIGR